ncbi:MAG: ice-binding family protein, partial [Myxococcota bacterium]
ILSGPDGYEQTFTGNEFLSDLAPGQYTARASAPGFIDATSDMNVVAGETSSFSLTLQPRPIVIEAPRAVYRNGGGNLIPLDAANLQSGQFFFYAWLEDEPLGIVPGGLVSGTTGDPGKPLLGEQAEHAPSFTQNLAVAWVGFMDTTGTIRPVIGADVRWEIDQQYGARVNSMQFGTSDDNRSAHNYGVFDDQADTRTNNASLDAERYPLVASEFPLYNQTGFGTPFVDGATWVTLFSPDAEASARIVAVATIDGEEIGKQILYKSFEPNPEIEITKTVDTSILNLDVGDTVEWTVTVTNVGTGDATSVSLSDFLASGDGSFYTAGSLPSGSTPAPGVDGFTLSFPLDSASALPPQQNTQLLGNAWSFAVLANTSVSNVGSSVVSGDVGISAGTSVTGFPPGVVLNGTIHLSDAASAAAQASLTAAKNLLIARPCTTGPVGVTDIGNTTVLPGKHCYSSSLALTGPVVLDAQGDPAAEFVFMIGSTLTTAAGASVSLINGASPCNVYWQVGSSATLGAATFFVGNILAYQDITAITGTSISGRALASIGQVTLGTTAVNAPLECVTAPGTSETLTFTGTVTSPGTYCNEIQVLSYSNTTQTWTPVDLGAEACFTAVESDVEIIKDFVAEDNTTSLGQSVTVARDVPARMRVRVINTGTGDASVIDVQDAFTDAMS